MKLAIAQLNFHIGNFESNEQKIIEAVERAKKNRVDLIIFPELAISGYPPRDFLEFNDFIDRCYQSVEHIAEKCTGIKAIVGTPTRNLHPAGKPLFNSAAMLADGKVAAYYHKSLLPNYDVFDEYRYFEPSNEFPTFICKGKKLAITICEDLWNIGEEHLYQQSPMESLYNEKPDIIVNIAASPFHTEQARIRKKILRENALKYHLPVVYVNHVGAQTELLFDGGSMIMNNQGEIIRELKYFDEDYMEYEFDDLQKTKPLESIPPAKIELIHEALVMGIKNYFNKLGFTKAVLGLSGGIDSAVTMVLAAKALGTANVKGILLPSRYSSQHSITDAVELAKTLGSPYEIINIEKSFSSFEETLKKQFEGLPFNLTEENIQARIRGVILMALSNKFGYILLNTSNKSEAAVGYGTLYGDMNGGISVLGDVYKTDVFKLARYINRQEEIIPENTIVKPPSAELRPDQKDSDSLPDYEILDEILYLYIEKRWGPKEILQKGFDKNIVDRTLRLVNINEYKRYQTAPVLRVSNKAFGIGRRMPIVAKYLT